MLGSDQVNKVNTTTLEKSMEGSPELTKGLTGCFHISEGNSTSSAAQEILWNRLISASEQKKWLCYPGDGPVPSKCHLKWT